MKLASTAEFLTRSDGLRPLQQAYGFEFALGNVVAMDPGAVDSGTLGRQVGAKFIGSRVGRTSRIPIAVRSKLVRSQGLESIRAGPLA
jgi:osmoprotectant transport system substrate-binding protein